MKKLITIIAIVFSGMLMQAQAYSEVSSDSVRFESDWYYSSHAKTVLHSQKIKVRMEKVVNMFVDNVLTTTTTTTERFSFKENDTLLKWNNGIVADTFAVYPVYTNPNDIRITRLIKRYLNPKWRLK